MASIGSEYLTMLDWTRRQKPGGGVDEIVEGLSQSNPIINQAAVVEGNLPTGHRTTVRTGLPAVSWRLLNRGVDDSKSTTAQVDDSCGILEGFSTVDVDEAMLNGDEAAFRASEDDAFMMAMNNEVSSSLFYANSATDPEKPLGLSPRYNSLSAANQENIIEGSESDDGGSTSIWLVTWGPKTCHLIFPKGSKAGLQSQDMGKQLVEDGDGKKYVAYVTHFQWKLGLCVRDWRYVVRIPNIDVSALTSSASTGSDLIDKMISAFYKRPTMDLGNMSRTYWYCNKTIAEFLHKQAREESNVNLSLAEVDGKPMTRCLMAPVVVCDALLNTESLVS